jgi:lipopolysaccharide/colanic/teichoic acid biosynthesis glycosyltransferase
MNKEYTNESPSFQGGVGVGFYRHFFKRLLDIVLSGVALLCLSPVLLVVTIWLHFANKGTGAFFTQERPGKSGKIFKIYKYKTMTDERDANGNLLPDADRLTKVGKFVRSTSIDELPQLWNVFIGDMSLIGPRPLLVQYLPLYSAEQARRHEVRPGITGWAQCHGRNNISWAEKFKLDVWYVDHVSFATDLKVIFTTINKVIRRADISQQGEATMEVFNGNN